ncbi:MAG: hypothetical protein A2161_19010, partial [Candidatus Schekmanbacteria bacterium RBG_13_48_7]
MNKVIFSIGAKLGAGGIGDTGYYIARELLRFNLLSKVICLENYKDDIPCELIDKVGFQKIREQIVRFLYKIPLLNTNTSTLSYLFNDNLFDFTASKKIQSCSIFYGWNHHSLFSIRKAKKMGADIILEAPTSHICFMEDALKQEYEKYSVNLNPETRILRKKTIQELIETDIIITPSEFAKNTFIQYGIPSEKLHVMPYGVDSAFFHPIPLQKDKVFRILFVGAYGLLKGLQYLLQACKELNLKNAELILCGWMKEDMIPILKKYQNTYTSKGFLNKDSLRSLYQQSDVLVMPSLAEGSALAVYEAMACGIPVIVTPNSGSI